MYWSYSFDYDWLISPDSEWLKSPDANTSNKLNISTKRQAVKAETDQMRYNQIINREHII